MKWELYNIKEALHNIAIKHTIGYYDTYYKYIIYMFIIGTIITTILNLT